MFVAVEAVWAKSSPALPSPLTLEDAMSYALQYNPTLTVVKEQLREQQGVLVQSFSAILPTVTATAQGNEVQNADQVSGGFNTLGGRKNWSADVTLRQTLFAGGSVVQGIRGSKNRMQAAKARVTSQIESTLYDVRQSFYAVLVNREIIKVREESLGVLEEQLKDVDAKFRAGVASQFELLQAQVAVANERPNWIRAKNEYHVSAESLAAVLGVPSRTELNPDDVQGELTPEELTVELQTLLDAAEISRADLRAAAKDSMAARADVWQERSSYLPRIEARAGYDWSKNATTTRIGEYVDGWNVGVVASIDLFNGFARESKVYQARARKRQAEAAELRTRLGVSVEVRQAYSTFAQAQEILASAAKVVEQARESLRMAKARYGAGSSTQLDVLQAQSALSQARLTELQAKYDYLVAVARLEKATGSHQWKVNVKSPADAQPATPVPAPQAE